MPKSKHPEREREHEYKHERERHPDRERKDTGDDPRAHAKIIARRWIGSVAPTPELFARAVRQWHALPGAVMWPATDVTAAPKKPAGSAGDGSKP
jgi:hypothetical protein